MLPASYLEPSKEFSTSRLSVSPAEGGREEEEEEDGDESAVGPAR